jgi:hypothetical protein
MIFLLSYILQLFSCPIGCAARLVVCMYVVLLFLFLVLPADGPVRLKHVA